MKKILIINFCLFFLIASCQKKKQVKNIISTNNSENIEIKKDTMPDLDIKSMKEMLEKEYDNIDSDTPSTAKTILWMNSEIYKALIKNGYKVPTKSNFESKIKTIFNINVNQPSSCSKIEINENHILIYGKRGFEIEKEKIFRSKFYPYDATENIFLMRKEHFINFILSPIALVIFPIDSTSYKVKIPQEIISRNKYLFNDDKSQFSWLTTNDSEFMRNLVITFGYVQDKKLLKWVIENNRFQTSSGRTNGAEYGKILWTKDCSGRFLFHKETLEVMKENISAKSNTNYLDDLLDYIRYLLDEKNKEEIKLSFQEKSLVLAHILYFGQNLAMEKEYHNYEFEVMGRFYELYDNDNKFDKEFSKNNYYDLQNFKNLWEQAKIYGDGMGEPEQ